MSLMSRSERDDFQKEIIEKESLKRVLSDEKFWEAVDRLLDQQFLSSDEKREKAIENYAYRHSYRSGMPEMYEEYRRDAELIF